MLDLELVREWTKGRFLMRSGFYAGRGPLMDDLNSSILEMFYVGIKKDVGKVAATNFVRFVNNLNDLSASAFIVAFEHFAASDGKETNITQQPGDDTRLSGHDNGLKTQAFAVIAQVLTNPKRSGVELQRMHNQIKYEFIQEHEKDIPTDERRQMEPSIYIY